ncbi:uncharacterized protein LOC130806355 [Amaranthus tricolor]|uniref:uncharacterized protein LOC130806355 n=1 Tax=Amaranthus tricolor TaxID=29722 RepID=UPI002588391E|nr:uncharacterized protein LOC130806355 [Amaranthus tricolor]
MRDEAAVSYSWVLERLRDIYGTVQTPDVIVTDRDEGLSAAIHAVFPDVRHLLCVWHIGNDVENMVDKLCGGKKNQQGQLFRQTKWNPLVNSMTIADFENRWEGIVSTWSTRNRRVVQYLAGTWIPHKEKFVRAWTNDCLHLGNQTTSRVESQHSSFKYYLGSGNSSFDTLFKRAHAQITNQQSKIRQALEESKNSISRTSRLNFLRPLYRHVSIFALELLMMEHNRMLTLGSCLLEKCGCVIQKTHGLPCACYCYLSIRSNGALYLDDIHPFWKTLKYLDAEEDANEEVRHANADDKEYFQSLVDEVLKSDPSVLRRVSQVLEHELHPDGDDIPEPEASPPRKGRPMTSRTLRRNKSAFEYSRSSSRGRGSRSSSRGRSSGRSSSRSHQSSVGINFSFNLSDGAAGRDFSLFPWPDHIPFILPPYLFDWIDVIGDGNCGFRAIAATELGGEEAWPLLRRAMSLEMETHREQYARLYLSADSVEEAIFRVGAHNKGPAPYDHWLEATTLYSAATFLNIAIAYYGSADGHPMYNCLVLPLRRTGGMHGVNKLIHILWVNGNHYVQLLMNDDSSPLPPVQQNWRAANNSCADLERQYRNRISLWSRMCNIQRQQHNNTAGDAVNLDSP